jgi:SP family sugar:H+ symporter-like MFS transporter
MLSARPLDCSLSNDMNGGGRYRVGLWPCVWFIVFSAVGSQPDPNAHGTRSVLILLHICSSHGASHSYRFTCRFSSTWRLSIWVAIGEIFPLHAPSCSASIATSEHWTWNFLLTFFTPFITGSIHYRHRIRHCRM